MKKTSLFLLLVMFMVGCANDLHFDLPKGANGADGKDGADGQSAYELWVDDVEDGLDDPYTDDGSLWDKDKTDKSDYYYYLSGKDGQNGKDGDDGKDGKSAYELWVEDVLDDDGLDHPHYDDDSLWPVDRITIEDYYDYLSGKDGADGADGKPGDPGTPGQTVTIVTGKYNVIARYKDQAHSEYVNWDDGSVLYTVYGKDGLIAPGAVVTAMPGMDAGLSFTANADGEFTVTKDQLPVDKQLASRFGAATVNGERSVANTYVPEKVEFRVRFHHVPDNVIDNSPAIYLSSGSIYTEYVIERRLEVGKDWEIVPDYVAKSITLSGNFFEVSDKNDPTSFATSQTPYYKYTDSSNKGYAYVPRAEKLGDYVNPNYFTSYSRSVLWDGNPHWYVLHIGEVYGQSASTPTTFAMAPIQRIPILGEMSAVRYDSYTKSVSKVSGTWDVSKVDYSLIFDVTAELNGNCWEWNVMDQTAAKEVKCLRAQFTFSSGSSNVSIYNNAYATLGNPTFTIDKQVYVGSQLSSLVATTVPGDTMFKKSENYSYFSGTYPNFTLRGTSSTYGEYLGVPTLTITYTDN